MASEVVDQPIENDVWKVELCRMMYGVEVLQMEAITWHDRKYRQEPSEAAFCQITLALIYVVIIIVHSLVFKTKYYDNDDNKHVYTAGCFFLHPAPFSVERKKTSYRKTQWNRNVVNYANMHTYIVLLNKWHHMCWTEEKEIKAQIKIQIGLQEAAINDTITKDKTTMLTTAVNQATYNY